MPMIELSHEQIGVLLDLVDRALDNIYPEDFDQYSKDDAEYKEILESCCLKLDPPNQVKILGLPIESD